MRLESWADIMSLDQRPLGELSGIWDPCGIHGIPDIASPYPRKMTRKPASYRLVELLEWDDHPCSVLSVDLGPKEAVGPAASGLELQGDREGHPTCPTRRN